MNRYSWFVLLVLAACTRAPQREDGWVSICLFSPSCVTRASDPEDNLISDYNLLIYNDLGILEEQVYVSSRELVAPEGVVRYQTRLLLDAEYWILAAANLGYALPAMTLDQALAYRFYLAYPDEYSHGIPMAVTLHSWVGDSTQLDVRLERLMSRIDLQMDRSALDPDVSMRVESVRIGACPTWARLFSPSAVETEDELFLSGFSKTGNQLDRLNREVSQGLSGEVSFYLLENRQKDTEDPRQLLLCSYLELRIHYYSSTLYTRPGEALIYRFYLGDEHDVQRNARYPYILHPVGDGLHASGWSIDKSALKPVQ